MDTFNNFHNKEQIVIIDQKAKQYFQLQKPNNFRLYKNYSNQIKMNFEKQIKIKRKPQLPQFETIKDPLNFPKNLSQKIPDMKQIKKFDMLKLEKTMPYHSTKYYGSLSHSIDVVGSVKQYSEKIKPKSTLSNKNYSCLTIGNKGPSIS